MVTRFASAAVALALVVVAVTGCVPEPEPSPTAPTFASEDEAFAAAEETYRAYVDAVNERRADASSDTDPQEFLTGDALRVDIDTQRQLDQEGLTISGVTTITKIDRVVANLTVQTVRVLVCLDSTKTLITNASGTDVTPLDRQPTQIDVQFVAVASALLISSSNTEAVGSC